MASDSISHNICKTGCVSYLSAKYAQIKHGLEEKLYKIPDKNMYESVQNNPICRQNVDILCKIILIRIIFYSQNVTHEDTKCT
jgi:hypothetical protein